MRIDIRAIGFSLTDPLRRHVERRVASALGPFSHRLATITVRLEDVNADRGGIDKRCSLVAAVRRRGIIVVEAMNADLYLAVDKVATRIRRSIRRRITRHVGRQRKNPQRPGALLAM